MEMLQTKTATSSLTSVVEKRHDATKKIYAKPQMNPVELRHRTSLLQNSSEPPDVIDVIFR